MIRRTTTTIAATVAITLATGACVRSGEIASTDLAPAVPAETPTPTAPVTVPPTRATETTAPETTAPPTTTPTSTTLPAPVLDPAINDALQAFGTWTTPTHVTEDDRALSPQQWDAGSTRTTCHATPPQTISRTFDELAAFPFDGPLHPGLIVEGAGVVDGELRTLPIERAPITLVSSLDSETPIADVAEPTSVTLQQAVTALKRDADAQFTGVDVTPADITYVRDEVHSFEQAYLGMGVSLRYASPGVRAQFESSFEQESQTAKHSIVARLVQPMFTIRAATDNVVEPGDFFDPTTSIDRIRELEASRRIGPDNVPTLIESVTYGRVMYFTMTSSTVSSASELEVAVEAAWGGLSGEAALTDAQRRVLSESRLEVIAFGGDQDVAFQALRTGRLGDFFSRVNTTTAAPLSMTMRTLAGGRVEIADETTFRSLVCTQSEVAKVYRVEVSNLNGFVEVFVNDRSIGAIENRPSGTITIPANRLRPGNNTVRIDYADWFPCLDGSITASVLVDGRATAERRHTGAACWFTWEWNLNTDAAAVSKI